MRVLIVGAGIAGLGAAIGMRRNGIDAVVVDQADEPRALGAGLLLWSNATGAMAAIGVGHLPGNIGNPIEDELVYSDDGERLVYWPVGDVCREIGFDTVAFTRPAILEGLLRELGVEPLQLGRRFQRFEQLNGELRVDFADGDSERCDLLIGADGLHSVVRGQLHGARAPRYAGYTSWRTIVRTPVPGLMPHALRQFWGAGCRAVCFGVPPPGNTYLVLLANAPQGGTDPPEGPKPRLLSRFGHFPDPVPALLEAADPDSFIRTDIVDRQPLRRWGRGLVTLVGDAAHPMTPNTSQGAGMAIEDAAALALSLCQPGELGSRLRAFERKRWKRVAYATMVARAPGELGRVSRRRLLGMRNRALAWGIEGPMSRVQIDFINPRF